MNRLFSFFRGYWPDPTEVDEPVADDDNEEAWGQEEGGEEEEEDDDDPCLDVIVEDDSQDQYDDNDNDALDDYELAIRLGACQGPASPKPPPPLVAAEPPVEQPSAASSRLVKLPQFHVQDGISAERRERQARIAFLKYLV